MMRVAELQDINYVACEMVALRKLLAPQVLASSQNFLRYRTIRKDNITVFQQCYSFVGGSAKNG